MKKTIIIVFFFLILFYGSTCIAGWVAPVGCKYDSWIMTNDSITQGEGGIYITFFNENEVACYSQLVNIDGSPLLLNGGQTIVASEFKDSTSLVASFFAGLLAITAFVVGVNGGKIV